MVLIIVIGIILAYVILYIFPYPPYLAVNLYNAIERQPAMQHLFLKMQYIQFVSNFQDFLRQIILGIIHYFQHFCKSTESMLRGGSKSSQLCAFKNVGLSYCIQLLVHETVQPTNILQYAFGEEGVGSYVKEYSLYECENGGWFLKRTIHTVLCLLKW